MTMSVVHTKAIIVGEYCSVLGFSATAIFNAQHVASNFPVRLISGHCGNAVADLPQIMRPLDYFWAGVSALQRWGTTGLTKEHRVERAIP